MFKKVLIANRGEIAVRLIRACRDLDISIVAVYSEADRRALHVQLADEAYFIGPSPSISSYLSIERILEAARQTKADAIHPGYGFLSENSIFANAVKDAGLTFIGPPASAIEAMGNKLNAREIALKAGVPVVPGSNKPVKDLDEILNIALKIGFPVMLKAASGGGGKGMRVVHSAEDLKSAFELASYEAASAFKDATVYVERYISCPRHIEIQLVGDKYGNLIYLGERECSIQRRNQKVIEECPSPLNDSKLRHEMGEAAVRLANIVGYHNVGTVEFLVDADKNFYFLEMNTRLQVEHPVTELVTGMDLAVLQIEMAAGKKLELQQEDIKLRGCAVECRVYAEDPEQNFAPSPGKITAWSIPEGPGVRIDSGVYEGWDIPLDYDPLLAKLICWGSTREQALAKLRRSLSEYVLCGVKNNLSFFQQVLVDQEFCEGKIDTGFIDRFLERKNSINDTTNEEDDVVLIAALLHYLNANNVVDNIKNSTESAWKRAGWKALQGTCF